MCTNNYTLKKKKPDKYTYIETKTNKKHFKKKKIFERYTPSLNIPLTGGGSALGTGMCTFSSGRGFLGTSGTLKTLKCV